MLNVQIDTSGVKKMVYKIKNLNPRLTKSIKNYMQILMGNGAVSIQGVLQEKILELVYMRDEPRFYKRTESLFDSVRVRVEDNNIHLYIDDQWLSNRPHVRNRTDISTGLARNARPNSPVPYSIRVEEDFTYKNAHPLGSHDNFREGSGYMKATFEQLKSEILSGNKRADKIIEPIFRSWS